MPLRGKRDTIAMSMPSPVSSRSVLRPFANAHWSLPVVLVVAWCLSLFETSCRPSPRYPDVVLATATVCIALWASHVRPRASSGWRRLGAIVLGAAGDLVRLLVIVVACGMVLAMLTPTYDCMTSKARAATLILSASEARTQIADHAARNHTLRGAGEGVAVVAADGAKWATVTEDGVIVVAGDDPAAVVVFQPVLANGQTTWTCKGLPSNLMPSTCR